MADALSGHNTMLLLHAVRHVACVSAAGRPWTGPSLQEVAEDMFNRGNLLVEAVDSVPGDACHPKPDWTAALRCYSPTMFNCEVSLAMNCNSTGF